MEWKFVFSQPGNTHTRTLEWGRHGRIILTPTEWFSSHHSQDAVQDDVQLHCGGVCVVQDGPGQLVHTVVSRQVQVLHDVVVAAHFLRGRPICCANHQTYLLYDFKHLQNLIWLDLFYLPEFNLWENQFQFRSGTFIIPECAIYTQLCNIPVHLLLLCNKSGIFYLFFFYLSIEAF